MVPQACFMKNFGEEGEGVTLHGTMRRESQMGVEVFGEGCFDYEFF